MSSSTKKTYNKNKTYPIGVSLIIIIAAIFLSFVDLAFLKEVIGRVLNLNETLSILVSFAIGLVGIAIMAHEGTREAHANNQDTKSKLSHYGLWIMLGLSIVITRIFSATILGLTPEQESETLLSISGRYIRQSDIVTTPLMFLLFIATGIMVKDGVKNLLMHPDYELWVQSIKNFFIKDPDIEKIKQYDAYISEGDNLLRDSEYTSAISRYKRAKSLNIDEEHNSIAQSKIDNVEKTKEHTHKTNDDKTKLQRYNEAKHAFELQDQKIRDIYSQINSNIDYIIEIDKDEKNYEEKVKPGLVKIIDQSILSAQNTVALMIRKKTDCDIDELHKTIEEHNINKNA